MSEATAGVFRHAAVHNIFGNTGGRVLMLVMTDCVSKEGDRMGIIALGNIELNILRPSNFLLKWFMSPLINFSFLFKAGLWRYFNGIV